MINGKKVIAIILARQGSKRLVNKNILSFAGKPLIAWTIIEAKKSKHIDDIIVSSDSDEILKISKKYGSKIIKRPKNLAKDTRMCSVKESLYSTAVIEAAHRSLKNESSWIKIETISI